MIRVVDYLADNKGEGKIYARMIIVGRRGWIRSWLGKHHD
jgi:hypothetical protein